MPVKVARRLRYIIITLVSYVAHYNNIFYVKESQYERMKGLAVKVLYDLQRKALLLHDCYMTLHSGVTRQ